ncbi:HAD family hydrolase [Candidatus Gottesmanbacteria bacterium]|nr:HAD family hydrolase [Candidatus Gottesmanbacteria bacterium]
MAPERESRCAMFTHPEHLRRVTELTRWAADNGIKAVLFDLDDTLVSTSPVIRDLEERYVKYVASQQPSLSPQQVLETLRNEDASVFASHSVSKARWSALAHKLVDVYGSETEETFHQGLAIFMSLYSTIPPLLPGAVDTVSALKCAVGKMGVVTHADEYWTTMKLHKTGLSTYFDHVHIVPDDGHKSSEHWKKAIDALGVEPHEVLVIGDSIRGDIQAAAGVGVKNLVLVPSQWAPYGIGELPPGVIVVSGIDKTVDALIGSMEK